MWLIAKQALAQMAIARRDDYRSSLGHTLRSSLFFATTLVGGSVILLSRWPAWKLHPGRYLQGAFVLLYAAMANVQPVGVLAAVVTGLSAAQGLSVPFLMFHSQEWF